jgi:hypothetical protein
VHRKLNGNLVLRLKHLKKALDVSATYAHLFRQM